MKFWSRITMEKKKKCGSNFPNHYKRHVNIWLLLFFYNRLFILISFTEHIKMLMTSRGAIVVMSLTFDMRYDMFNERHLNMWEEISWLVHKIMMEHNRHKIAIKVTKLLANQSEIRHQYKNSLANYRIEPVNLIST